MRASTVMASVVPVLVPETELGVQQMRAWKVVVQMHSAETCSQSNSAPLVPKTIPVVPSSYRCSSDVELDRFWVGSGHGYIVVGSEVQSHVDQTNCMKLHSVAQDMGIHLADKVHGNLQDLKMSMQQDCARGHKVAVPFLGMRVALSM